MLHVDAAVGPVTVMFSGAKEPIAAAGSTAVFGKLAVGRQVTAAPETYKRRLDVGRCRDVEIEVQVKNQHFRVPISETNMIFVSIHCPVLLSLLKNVRCDTIRRKHCV